MTTTALPRVTGVLPDPLSWDTAVPEVLGGPFESRVRPWAPLQGWAVSLRSRAHWHSLGGRVSGRAHRPFSCQGVPCQAYDFCQGLRAVLQHPFSDPRREDLCELFQGDLFPHLPV